MKSIKVNSEESGKVVWLPNKCAFTFFAHYQQLSQFKNKQSQI